MRKGSYGFPFIFSKISTLLSILYTRGVSPGETVFFSGKKIPFFYIKPAFIILRATERNTSKLHYLFSRYLSFPMVFSAENLINGVNFTSLTVFFKSHITMVEPGNLTKEKKTSYLNL